MPVAVREGEECVEEFVDLLSGEENAARHFVPEGETDDKESFVDIVSGITAVSDVELDGWTFADGLAHAKLSTETLAEGVIDPSRLPTC